MREEKISAYQLYCLIFNFTFGSTTILQSLTSAGRDTWISTVIAVLAGLGMVTVTTRLAELFPDKTLVDYARTVFGKAAGTVISVFYLWFFLHLGALVLRNYAEFLSGLFMPETPLPFFSITLVAVCMFFVCCGIEVKGRVSEIIFPVIVLLAVSTTVLVAFSGVMDMKNVLPVLEHGFFNVLKGAVPIAAFPYLEIVLFTMVFPLLNDVKKARRAAVSAILVSGVLLSVVLLQGIAVFGENLATFTFPRYAVVRLISIGNFLERVDSTVIIIWIMAALVKVSTCLYAFVLGLSRLLALPDYRILVFPSSALMATLSVLVYENTFEMLDFAVNIWPVYAFPFQVILPLVMLILASYRKKRRKK